MPLSATMILIAGLHIRLLVCGLIIEFSTIFWKNGLLEKKNWNLVRLPEAEGDEDFEIVDDITEEEIPTPNEDGDEDFDLSDDDFSDEEPIEEITDADQDPEMIMDAKSLQKTQT